jgi:hypothetical protein
VEKRGAGSGREVTALSRTRNNLDPVWKEALESISDPEVLLRLVGSVATATSAAEVLAAIQKETQGA